MVVSCPSAFWRSMPDAALCSDPAGRQPAALIGRLGQIYADPEQTFA